MGFRSCSGGTPLSRHPAESHPQVLIIARASVALSLLFEEYASHIHINDLNPGVYAFWESSGDGDGRFQV